ncbi:hypothetical protein AYO21_09139 [Fonsecaea monophora]|uniref:Uncharacterized protein n=1 Tax=Fonsecaea monophora TaxID=254056 RepID=A0A177EX71_9EURO|nr:hypothetical protein AYO21_09139 [Fonsecaea monophora]OAG36664.1 hypothetical protein AYO21_09139 [Fonsecaea monophora]
MGDARPAAWWEVENIGNVTFNHFYRGVTDSSNIYSSAALISAKEQKWRPRYMMSKPSYVRGRGGCGGFSDTDYGRYHGADEPPRRPRPLYLQELLPTLKGVVVSVNLRHANSNHGQRSQRDHSDEVTGKEFKPNMLISTKNLARGVGGGVQDKGDAPAQEYGRSVVPGPEEGRAQAPEGGRGYTREEVDVHGHQQEGEDGQGLVRDYTCITAQTHSHDQTLPVHGIQVDHHPEGENYTSVVRDAIIIDNYVVFTSCPVYNRTVIGCDRLYPKPPSTENMARYSMLVLAVFAEVYMYNTLDFVPLGIKFIS